jgi:hypothetical protein
MGRLTAYLPCQRVCDELALKSFHRSHVTSKLRISDQAGRYKHCFCSHRVLLELMVFVERLARDELVVPTSCKVSNNVHLLAFATLLPQTLWHRQAILSY